MKWLKRLFWPALLGLMILVSISAVLGTMAIAPHASPAPKDDGRMRNFTLRSDDGHVVAASHWAGERRGGPGILLLHGVDGSRDQMVKTARALNDMGYAVLAIDFRGHGQSDQLSRSFGLFEAKDAKAGFDWLSKWQEGGAIGVVGLSMGGAAALLGDEGPLPAKCMVLQTVYPDIRSAIHNRIASGKLWFGAWAIEPFLSYQSRLRYGVWPSRIAPIDAIKRYKGPLLVIGGADDSYTPPDEIRALAAAAPGQKEVWIIKDRDHAEISGENSPRYRERLVSFFEGCLGPALVPDLPPVATSSPAQGQYP